jgi:hypothetical protein
VPTMRDSGPSSSRPMPTVRRAGTLRAGHRKTPFIGYHLHRRSQAGKVARARGGHVGGNSPCSIRISRSSTRYSSLMWSRATVTRPMAVRPTRYGPSQRKCFAHLWRRGLNSGVSLRVMSSIPLISEPLNELHRKQLRARLMATVGPRCFRERIWSISNGRSSAACGIWSGRRLARYGLCRG